MGKFDITAQRIDIALYEPEIPPNTGNILRLCANANSHLHLIEPFGFELTEKSLIWSFVVLFLILNLAIS